MSALSALDKVYEAGEFVVNGVTAVSNAIDKVEEVEQKAEHIKEDVVKIEKEAESVFSGFKRRIGSFFSPRHPNGHEDAKLFIARRNQFHLEQRRKAAKRRRRGIRFPSFPAATTVPIIMETEQPTVVQEVEGELAKVIPINRGMPYYGSIRKRRSRRKRRRKAVTKRSVKALIARSQGMSKWNYFANDRSWYIGKVTGTTPTPTDFGEVRRESLTFFGYAATLNSGTATSFVSKLDAMLPAKVLNEGNFYQYWAKKPRVKVMLHNPMNEVVRATFWLVDTIDSSDLKPEDFWSHEYGERERSEGNSQVLFANNFTTYPTEFVEWKKYYKIRKKYKTIFQPGQTKELNLKLHGFKYVQAENDEEAGPLYLKGITQFLMMELKGVPTHQNDATTQTVNINYSPAALDVLWHKKYQGARSGGPKGLVDNYNNMDTVTAGISQLPEQNALIVGQ